MTARSMTRYYPDRGRTWPLPPTQVITLATNQREPQVNETVLPLLHGLAELWMAQWR